jgi:hypothetical protein
MLVEPPLELFGPKAPLTEKLFKGDEGFAADVADVAIKLAPLAVGIGTAGGGGLALRKFTGTLAADMLIGMVSGAASGATEGVIREENPGPPALIGALLGTGGGIALNHLSKPGRELARQYAARPGRGAIPNLDDLDAEIPHVPFEGLEDAARRRAELHKKVSGAARAAFRKFVPEGTARESVHPAVWRLARKEAAAAARQLRAAPGSLEEEGTMIGILFRRILEQPDIHKSLDALRSIQNVFVTRLATTLTRDKAAFKDVGAEFADKILRTETLKDHLEGRLVHNIWRPDWKDVPVHEETLIDDFLSGRGARLSTPGLANASRWRERDDAMFAEARRLGLMEEVGPEHPAAQALAEATGGAVPRYIPLQYRSNHVPHYIDRRGMTKLASKGSPEHQAFIQKMIQDGEADNVLMAEKKLAELLEQPFAGSALHIRTAFQHERGLTLNLPRERNAKVWQRRAYHDFARRAAQAKVWGPQDEVFVEMHKRLAAAGGDADRLERLFKIYVGRPPRDTGTGNIAALARNARSFSTISLLGPRVGILQYMQLVNPAARLGIRTTLGGIVAGWRNPGLRGVAEEVGALLPSEHLLTTVEPMSQWGEWWIRNIAMMPRADRGARNVSAIAGGLASKKWAQEYWKLTQADAAAGSPSLARGGVSSALKYVGVRNRAERIGFLRRKLEEDLGIPIQLVIKNEGELPIEAVMAAMQTASHKTQFASSILDLPEGRHTPIGKFIFTLRTFAKQQTPFVNKMVSDAVKYGDTGPIVRFLLLYPAIYETARPFLDFLAGREFISRADQDTRERIAGMLEGALWTGLWGSMGDFINQLGASNPKAKLMQYAAGAPISQITDIVANAAHGGLTGNYGPFYAALYKNVVPSPAKAIIQHANQ